MPECFQSTGVLNVFTRKHARFTSQLNFSALQYFLLWGGGGYVKLEEGKVTSPDRCKIALPELMRDFLSRVSSDVHIFK